MTNQTDTAPETESSWPGLLAAIEWAQRADQTIVVYVHPDCSWDVFNAHTSADLLNKLRAVEAAAPAMAGADTEFGPAIVALAAALDAAPPEGAA